MLLLAGVALIGAGWVGPGLNRMADAEMERLLVLCQCSRPITAHDQTPTTRPTVAEAGPVMGKRPIQAVRLTQRVCLS